MQSKLGLITKLKPDSSPKYWLIWDLLRSDVKSTCPSPTGSCCHGWKMWWRTAGTSSGFTGTRLVVMPIRPSVQQFMCGLVGPRYLVFEVLGKGGRSSPNIWGRCAAATGRVVSSVFNGDEFRCEIHVDDPLLAAPAKDHASSLSRCWPSPCWASLPLGTRPVSATEWFGSAPSSQSKTPVFPSPSQKTSSRPFADRQPTQFLSTNVARKKDLRSFCGKLSFVAGMVPHRCGLSLT